MQNWKTWFAIVVLGWGIFQAARFTEAGSGIDYLHFWIIPRSVADWDIRNIYDPQAQELILQRAEQELPEELSVDGLARLNTWLGDYRQLYETGLNPTGTPFFYAVQNLPGGKDIEIGFLCFQWASTFGLIVAVGLIGAALRAPPWSWILLAGLLLAIYKPLFLDIAVANVNRFQLLQVALAIGAGLTLRTRNRWLIAGLILGLAASYKPNVLLGSVALAILLVVDSRRRDGILLVAGWLAAVLVALAAGSIFMGTPAAWSDWWVLFWQDMGSAFSPRIGQLFSLPAGPPSRDETDQHVADLVAVAWLDVALVEYALCNRSVCPARSKAAVGNPNPRHRCHCCWFTHTVVQRACCLGALFYTCHSDVGRPAPGWLGVEAEVACYLWRDRACLDRIDTRTANCGRDAVGYLVLIAVGSGHADDWRMVTVGRGTGKNQY